MAEKVEANNREGKECKNRREKRKKIKEGKEKRESGERQGGRLKGQMEIKGRGGR